MKQGTDDSIFLVIRITGSSNFLKDIFLITRLGHFQSMCIYNIAKFDPVQSKNGATVGQ